MIKTLVIYYSRAGENYFQGQIKNIAKGNTAYIADFINQAVGSDLFRIETKEDYSSDYTECTRQAKKELQEQARPELKNYLKDIREYENIVIAGPCWWGNYPMAIFSQLDRLNFNGKKVFPVMTHEGSGEAESFRSLQKHCLGAEVMPTLALRGSSCPTDKEAVFNWAWKNSL